MECFSETKVLLCHIMDEFHQHIDQIHTVGQYTYELQKQAKLTVLPSLFTACTVLH